MTKEGTTPILQQKRARPGADGVVPVIRPVDAQSPYDESTPDDTGDSPDDGEGYYNTPITPQQDLNARPVGSLAFLGLAALAVGGVWWWSNRKKKKKSRRRR